MTTMHKKILQLPIELQNKIYHHYLVILHKVNAINKSEYLFNASSIHMQNEHNDIFLYILLRKYDLDEFGFTGDNILNVGLVGTLGITIRNMETNLYNLRTYMKEHFIEINIMNNLLKQTVKIQTHIIENDERKISIKKSNLLLQQVTQANK